MEFLSVIGVCSGVSSDEDGGCGYGDFFIYCLEHKNESDGLMSFFKRVPLEVLEHLGDTAEGGVVMAGESSCSSLNLLKVRCLSWGMDPKFGQHTPVTEQTSEM